MTLWIGLAVVAVVAVAAFLHHQKVLRDRAHLMREAVRNEDFMFALPVRGLLPGERALQQALNDMCHHMGRMGVDREVDAWQRLTRVLTHEIMNAMAPIASISQAYLACASKEGSPYEEGLRAIHDTSAGLSAFVANYRKLSCLECPEPAEVDLADFVDSVEPLYPQLRWHTHLQRERKVTADPGMLRQVMVNLLKNAIEAGARDVDVRWSDGLMVSNNGQPISGEVERELFVPFFTTKPKGSGIGLSLSRQLMVRQGGDLRLSSRQLPGYAVTFIIVMGERKAAEENGAWA